VAGCSSVGAPSGGVRPRHFPVLDERGLREAPAFGEVGPELVRRPDGAAFTAHNADFDWGFVARALRRAGYQPPDTTRLCTARLSRAVAAEAASHRLADVCERHGITIARAHDAASDAEATAAVLPLLLADGDLASLDDLAPHLRGNGARWPSWSPPARWRRWVYG